MNETFKALLIGEKDEKTLNAIEDVTCDARPAVKRMGLSKMSIAALVALTLTMHGCSVNPVTGKREVVLMSPEREAALGKQGAAEIERDIGLVDAPQLQQYIETLGRRLARNSPRKDVDYSFFVADMQEPNAFALPGGYIYVSRGLLEIANSEAELANVIGHEIGHVAARHSAQRDTRATGVGVLSAIGTIAAGVFGGAQAAQSVAQLGQVAGAGLIASYGRDQERQSDEIGQRLAADQGWDPAAMSSFLATLDRDTTHVTGEARRPTFLDSHPITAERVRDTAARAGTLAVQPAPPIAGSRAEFYARLDNLLVGADPAEGVFQERLFLHPGLDFALEFPKGWQSQNQKAAVIAASPKRDAIVSLESQGPSGDPQAAAQAFAQQNNLQLQGRRSLKIGGLSAFGALAKAQTQQGSVGVHVTWIAHPKGMFRITGTSSVSNLNRYSEIFRNTANSFRRLSKPERDSISERRLRVVKAQRGESLAALSKRTKNRWSVEETAIANGLSSDTRFAAGDVVKVVVEVPYRP